MGRKGSDGRSHFPCYGTVCMSRLFQFLSSAFTFQKILLPMKMGEILKYVVENVTFWAKYSKEIETASEGQDQSMNISAVYIFCNETWKPHYIHLEASGITNLKLELGLLTNSSWFAKLSANLGQFSREELQVQVKILRILKLRRMHWVKLHLGLSFGVNLNS